MADCDEHAKLAACLCSLRRQIVEHPTQMNRFSVDCNLPKSAFRTKAVKSSMPCLFGETAFDQAVPLFRDELAKLKDQDEHMYATKMHLLITMLSHGVLACHAWILPGLMYF